MDDAHNEADKITAEALRLQRREVGALEPLLVPLVRTKTNLRHNPLINPYNFGFVFKYRTRYR
jgi:hypothetical protein